MTIRVGITTRITTAQGYSEDRDALAQAWGAFLSAALPDALWMALPNLAPDRIVAYCSAWGIDRLILSSGENIGMTPRRDAAELALLDWAETRSLPILGICRGMQVMAHREGVNAAPHPGHVAVRHGLSGERSGEVNSFHSLALNALPAGYRTLATADDGSIEAMRHRTLPWEGWMWHPERETPWDPEDIGRLRKLFA